MSEAKQLTDDEVLALFIGAKLDRATSGGKRLWNFSDLPEFCKQIDIPENRLRVFYSHDLRFDTSWDWLMPACHKFDNLDLTVKTSRSAYCDHCDAIDNAVVTYDIAPAYRALVAAIRWYNSTLNPDKP